MIAHAQDLPDRKASVEVPGLKVVVDKTDTWETIGMILVLVLGIYLGIRLINKFIKDKNEKA